MKIIAVEAFPLRAGAPKNEVYWGKKTWGEVPKIVGRELNRHEVPSHHLPQTWRRRPIYSETIDTTIVRISTDTGLVGYGEAKAPVGPEITAGIINGLLAELLKGEDPTNPAYLWERMYGAMRIRGHSQGFWMEAMSGVDIALWDLLGKHLDIPLYSLFGGAFREKVKVYASGIPGTGPDSPEEEWIRIREAASQVRDMGFHAVKLAIGLGIEADIRTVETVKEVVGEDLVVYVDAAGMYDYPEALRLGRALEDLGVGWYEAPLSAEDVQGYQELTRQLRIPIASDLVYNRWQVRDLLKAGAVDVVQPDILRAGGITATRRIAELADAYHKAVTPHVSIGSVLQYAAAVHLAAATPNQAVMEYWYGANPLGAELGDPSITVDQGFCHLPKGPGLGVHINELALRKFQP